MKNRNEKISDQVKNFCVLIGNNPLLVQGSGGNISWKEGNLLWIKASGMWLSDASSKNIFVQVDLNHLKNAIHTKELQITPKIVDESKLRPSIETLLHALMPHKIVLHLHAIEVLAHLVKEKLENDFKNLLNETSSWGIVDYYKPGIMLANKVNDLLNQNPELKVIFLRSHGLVIGGENIKEVSKILNKITHSLRTKPKDVLPISKLNSFNITIFNHQYERIDDLEVNQLALNPILFNQIRKNWAIYPDHIVFLGRNPHVYQSINEFKEVIKNSHEFPELIFIYGEGVYTKPNFNKSKSAQLRCYYDIMSRQKPEYSLKVFSDTEINELLNWDAEIYRIEISI